MRNICMAGLMILLTASAAQAVDLVYVQGGVVEHPTHGELRGDAEIGLGWQLPWQWAQGSVNTRLDLAGGYTSIPGGQSLRVLAMPVVRWQSEGAKHRHGWFAELGIGTSYLSNTLWSAGYDLNTHMQFEDRLGIGCVSGANEYSLNLTHISNAGIKEPNPGTEIVSLRYARQF